MKTSTASGKLLLSILVILFCFSFKESRSQNCDLCKISSFPSITVYQVFQTGHGMGFGVEAGSWKKDAGKFSSFIGTSLVWSGINNQGTKTEANSANQTLLSFYYKGQYQLTSHLYAIAAPGIVNLSYFELQTGFRYVVPVSKVIAIGVEPSYAFTLKQLVVNANLHIALR